MKSLPFRGKIFVKFCFIFFSIVEGMHAVKWLQRGRKGREGRGASKVFKGTVSHDFLMLVFCIKLILLVPLKVQWDDSNFFRIFVEIFEYEIVSAV